jgi:hypothetical protein
LRKHAVRSGRLFYGEHEMGEQVETPENEKEAPQMSMAEEAAQLMEESAKELSGEGEGDDGENSDPAPKDEAPTEADQAPEAEKPETPDAENEPDESQQQSDGGESAGSEPDELKSLNAEERELFAAMPAEAQALASAFMRRREGDMERGFVKKTQAIADLRRDFQPMQDFFAPHRDELRTAGLTPFTYMKRLHDLDQMASQDPNAYAEYMLTNLPIDKAKILAFLGGQEKTAEDDGLWGEPDPQPAPAPAAQPAPAPAPQPQVANPSVLAVNEFMSAVDQNGVLLHPYFAQVRQDMADLATVYSEDNLPALYEKACLARGLIAGPAPSLPAKQGDEFDEARKKVAKAQTASSVASSDPTAPTPPNFDNMSSAQMIEYFATGGK